MTGSGSTEGTEPLFSTLAKALKAECDHLQIARREMSLCGGRKVGAFAGCSYYRFEIPEESLPRNTERTTFTIGHHESVVVEANIISIDNQYLTVALPRDFGALIPETRCSWNYEHQLQPVINALTALDPQSPIPTALFHPDIPENTHVVGFEPEGLDTTPPEQVEAVRKILKNKVTILWGAMRCGKTHTLALAAATYLKAGKRVLFVAPTNDNVDEMLLRTVELGAKKGISIEEMAVRVDLPSLAYAQDVAKLSFEHQVETMREEKRTVFHERVSLLKTYWRVRIKQIMYEDDYQQIAEVRARAGEAKRQSELVAKEIKQLTEALQHFEQASVLERLKKGFSKEEIEAVQHKMNERQKQQKRHQALHLSLTDEAVHRESNAPISQIEVRDFRVAVKRMDELGGLEKVTQAVEAFITVDESALLRKKNFIATSVATAFLDPLIRSQTYDLVLVDDAQTVNLPTLAALAGLAREKFVVAGDPFQLQPDSSAHTESARQWLQRDIFLHIANTDELNRLFDWTDQHAQVCVLLKSLYASTPRLSMFVASVLYDNKIDVVLSQMPKGRIFFIDTSEAKAKCRQYAGRKRILPYNDYQTKKTLDCVKHALVGSDRQATDVGIILPFTGPTLYTKLQLRLQGIDNLEVGTPATFAGTRKRAVIFDTTMAGVDYTVRAVDDKKIGEHRIARMFNTVLSCVDEDLYVLADLSHFRALYADRLFVRLLMLLQAEADQKHPAFSAAVKRFDEMDLDKRAALFAFSAQRNSVEPIKSQEVKKVDAELEIQLQMLAQKSEGKQEIARNFEREIFVAVHRVLGYRLDINLLSQFVGGDILFRGNLRSEESTERLSTRSCENEREFRNVMEVWNLLIYEMSGGNKTDTPLFAQTNPEARVRQDIRNLRSFYSRDVWAIMEEGKQKIAVEVSKVFQDLIGRSQLPGNAEEWSKAYIKFLQRLEAYLSWIEEQLRK
jgi:hypothetical protein